MRSKELQLSDLYPVDLDEDVVRRLCGEATFIRADAMERVGHVFGAELHTDMLIGQVRGTWRRIDQIVIPARARKMSPTCSRHGDGYCHHVGALLLHWVRSPGAFGPPSAIDPLLADDPSTIDADSALMWGREGSEFLMAELADCLEEYTIDALRNLAIQCGFKATGTKKVDVISSVAAGLGDPARVDAAVAALSPDERMTLDAIDLITAHHEAREKQIAEAFEAIGGNGKPAINALAAAGMVLSTEIYDPAWMGYLVPMAITARLPAIDYLAKPVPEEHVAAEGGRENPLGLAELLQLIALAAIAGVVQPGEPAPTDRSISLPQGLVLGPRVGDKTHKIVADAAISESSLTELSAKTRQSRAHVDFAVRLMFAAGVLQSGPSVILRKDRLQELLERSIGDRTARLIDSWMTIAGPVEVGYIAEVGVPLHISWQRIERSWSYPFDFGVQAFGRLLLRLISRLPPGHWFALEQLNNAVQRLLKPALPAHDQFRNQFALQHNLKISHGDETGQQRPLSLKDDNDWKIFTAGIVESLVRGPLQWLGLIDIAQSKDQSTLLRVSLAAGVLAGREIPSEEQDEARRIQVRNDLTIQVPAGSNDMVVHSRLSAIAELVDASAEGLRYRLTPHSLHEAIDTGATGPQIIELLTELAGEKLPRPVVRTIEQYWQEYGVIRLYDELTLIELADDMIEAELMAGTPLSSFVVHVFSPRLLAINPSEAEAVAGVLAARGYAPRVVDVGS